MRINIVSAIIGKRGCGKTTYTLSLIGAYHERHPEQRILIVDTLDHPAYAHIPTLTPELLPKWKPGSIYRMFGGNTNEMLKAISTNLKNCFIIFEDASKYIKKNLQPEVRTFIFDSKQKNLDVLFLFHGFKYVPPELFNVIELFTIFKCSSPLYRRSVIDAYDEVEKAWTEVMKSKNPYYKKTIRVL